MTKQAVAIFLAVAVSAALWAFGSHTATVPPAVTAALPPATSRGTPVWAVKASADRIPSEPTPQASTNDLRGTFKVTNDYAVFADSVRGAAEAGDAGAQYYLAESLGYCQQNLSRFFTVAGKPVRTLDEAQMRWANRPAGYQEELLEIHTRCHAFLDDYNRRAQLDEWRAWLDKASDQGYPLAQSTKAGLMRSDALVAAVSSDPTMPSARLQATAAQDLALQALKSRDPEVIWGMVNLVDDRGTSTDEAGVLPAAWQVLACERGYDCSAKAEWVRSACQYGQLCNIGDTGEQYIEKQLGNNFQQARQLAEQIGAALDNADWSKVASYLGSSS